MQGISSGRFAEDRSDGSFRPSRPCSDLPFREIDPSESSTYGQQELTFFNGHYDTHMYFPFFLVDAKSGYLLTPLLRPGNSNPVAGALVTLAYVVPMLRAAFPGIRIDFRADSSFSEPNLLNWLDDERIPYTVGIGSNSVLKALSANFVHAIEKSVTVRPIQAVRPRTPVRPTLRTPGHLTS